MPQQVDKTRSGSPPPASKSQPIAQPIADTPAPAVSPAQAIAPTPTPAPPAARTADEKIYKVHQTKIRSLSRPLDPKVSRDASAAVEFVVDESANRVRAWIGARGKYAPTAAAAGLGTGKPERLWVPNVRPQSFPSLISGHARWQALRLSRRQVQVRARRSCEFPRPVPLAPLTSAPLRARHISPTRCAARCHLSRPCKARWRPDDDRRRPRPRPRMVTLGVKGICIQWARLLDLLLDEEDVLLDCALARLQECGNGQDNEPRWRGQR